MERRPASRRGCGAGDPYVLYRRHHRRAVRAELARQIAIEPPDVFYLDHLDSLAYSDLGRQTPMVIDLHNVYSRLVHRVSTEQNPWWKRWYLRRESRLLAAIEQRAAHLCDHLLAVSEVERCYFEGQGARAVQVVPNGVDCDLFRALPTGRVGQPPLVLYLGNLSWGPNIRAAVFLARTVLPRLRDRFPDARLRIVGRSPAPEVKATSGLEGVDVLADVPDITPHLREARVLAVPLDSGGGTRLKILEAFAAGLPVLSTPIGCEGLGVRHSEHLLISDREHFAEGIASLLDDDALAVELAARARTLASQYFDWSIVAQGACAVVSDMANPRKHT